MAEGAPLLREYTLIAYRGFESLLLRHLIKSASLVEALSFGALMKRDENRGFDQIRLKEYLAPSRLSDEARGVVTALQCKGRVSPRGSPSASSTVGFPHLYLVKRMISV